MIRLSDSVMKSGIDGEIVLLDGSVGVYFSLNSTGARMLELVLQETDREATIATLVAEFEAEEATIRKDLAQLLDELLSRKLIRADES